MLSETFPLGAQKSAFVFLHGKTRIETKKMFFQEKKIIVAKKIKKWKKKKRKKENRSMGNQYFILRLSSFESTEEARVALDCASSNSYASLVLSKLPTCTHNSIYER